MFASKADLPEGSTIYELHSRAGSWPYPQTLDKAGKACQGQTLQFIANINKLRP
jgi:hypothetical protein